MDTQHMEVRSNTRLVLSLQIRRAGGVLCSAVVGGMVDLPALVQLRQRMREELALRPAVKVLLDLRRTVLLLGRDDVLAFVSVSRLVPAVPGAPLGFLVERAHEQVAYAYCEAIARNGRTRLTFTDEPSALRWAGLEELPA